MGLTTRTLAVAARTVQQLSMIGVSLEQGSIHSGDLQMHLKEPATYTQGILFAGDRNEKGTVLKQFFAEVGYSPSQIVFIDDKLKHVQSVEVAMKELAVPFLGFRYGVTDAKVKAFNEDIRLLRLFSLGELAED